MIFRQHPAQSIDKRLSGLESVSKDFKRILQANRHHAWIFAGPRGIGKAQLAFRTAISLMLMNTGDSRCSDNLMEADFGMMSKNISAYRQLIQLHHPDFILISSTYELHSVSERKKKELITIDEVREIKKRLSLTSAQSDYRIVLIDGIEYMNINAANSFLKILEEPSDKIMFFIITHKLGDVLPTILSRSQIIKFSSLSAEDFTSGMLEYDNRLTYDQIMRLFSVTKGDLGLSQLLVMSNFEALISILEEYLFDERRSVDVQSLREKIRDCGPDILKTLLLYILRSKVVEVARSHNIIAAEFYIEKFHRINTLLNLHHLLNLDLFGVAISVRAIMRENSV